MEKIRLKEIVNIRTGFQVRSRLTPIDEGSHCVIQMRNICPIKGKFIDDIEFCKVTPNQSNIDRYLLKQGDLLFLTRGNNHPATLITEDYQDFVAAGQFMVLSLRKDECLPEYLCWYLNSPESKTYFKREARGTSVKIIDKKTVENLVITVPDLQTQKNIVELSKLALQEEELLDFLKAKRAQLIYAYCKQKIT